MSTDDSDLYQLLGEGMERIRTALDAVEDDELSDGEADSVRETADAVAEEVADASLDELLAATGFEDVSDDVAPPDIPILIQEADPDAVLGLRHLLEMADLSEEWPELDAGERIDRLERIAGDETSGEDDRSMSDLLSAVLSSENSDEATTEEETESEDDAGNEDDEAESDETGSEGDEATEKEDESSAVEETLTELRSLFKEAGSGDGDEETAEAAAEPDEGSGRGRGGGRQRATTRTSTMPSSRSDMGGSSRHSTMPDKN
ncbi:hypothetical protein ACFFQF_08095 [Haladaptatus pallidirubidus]|uniref:Uncharacterized protein n=1 Tax=Haladaptatus pallidirubidus TaxID=1008152 RepID=A0AAV3UGE9_9EURY|nr:hypothetical protein [Haladaptatus pallidirubidus]